MKEKIFQKVMRLCGYPLTPVIAAVFILIGIPLLKGETLIWGVSSVQFIPWYEAAFQQIVDGRLPLWNDLNGLGAPLLANYQLAFFYPPTWIIYLFRALGGTAWMAWSMYLVIGLHIIWSGFGMVHLARKLGMGKSGQRLSALAFALSSYWIGRESFATMIYAGAWLPWVIWAVTVTIGAPVKHLEGVKKPLYLLAIVVTFQLFAGHAQLTFYTLVLAGLWAILAGWINNRWKGVFLAGIQFTGMALVAVLISGIQLAPTFEYLQQSQRAEAVDIDAALTYSFWPWRFVTLIAPDFFGNPGIGNYWGYANYWEDAIYIGVWPLIFSFLSIRSFLKIKKKSDSYKKLRPFLWLIIAVGSIFALGKNTPIYTFLYDNFPTFDMFNAPSRWMVWVVFGLAILAASEYDEFCETLTYKGKNIQRIIVFGIALIIGVLVGRTILPEVEVTFIDAFVVSGVILVAGGLLLLFQKKKTGPIRAQIYSIGFFVLMIVDLVGAGINLNPTVTADYYSTIANNGNAFPDVGRIYISKNDENRIKFERFFRFSDLRSLEGWGSLRSVHLPNLNIIDGIQMVNNFDPFVPDRFAEWMNYLDTLVDTERKAWLAAVNTVYWEQRDIQSSLGISTIGINYPAGRAQWYGCAITPRDADDALRLVANEFVKDSSVRKAVIEGLDISTINCIADSKATMIFTAISQEQIVIEVSADKDGWLILADTNFPGWIASIDQQQTQIYQANYLLRGIRVEAGEHEIRFIYRPVSLIIGAFMTFVGIMVIVIWRVFDWKKRKIKHDNV